MAQDQQGSRLVQKWLELKDQNIINEIFNNVKQLIFLKLTRKRLRMIFLS